MFDENTKSKQTDIHLLFIARLFYEYWVISTDGYFEFKRWLPISKHESEAES